VDDQARADWRERLRRAYGGWCCPVCKTAYADQAQLEQFAGIAEIVRHSECGHVLTYRAGGALELLKPYVPDQHGETLPYALPPRRSLVRIPHPFEPEP
jgi:hypothetical protein